jgi:transposase
VSTNGVISTGRRRRRRHSDLFKSEAIGACMQEGVSIAAVALARGVNASLLRRWLKEAERNGAPIAIQSTMPSPAAERVESFIPVSLPPSSTERPIRVQVRRKGRRVSIEWPASAARECALLLQELLK